MPKAPKGIPREHPNAASSHMGDRCVAATSLRCCGGTPGDQDGRGTNELSKIESILGTRMSQNLSRDRRLACVCATGPARHWTRCSSLCMERAPSISRSSRGIRNCRKPSAGSTMRSTGRRVGTAGTERPIGNCCERCRVTSQTREYTGRMCYCRHCGDTTGRGDQPSPVPVFSAGGVSW